MTTQAGKRYPSFDTKNRLTRALGDVETLTTELDALREDNARLREALNGYCADHLALYSIGSMGERDKCPCELCSRAHAALNGDE